MQRALSPQASLVWLKVPSRNCTQFNHAEAQVAANIVVGCLKAGLSSHEIAVVTPFRRQVMHIRNLISAQLGDNYELPIVDTVERVQGLTVEAVVVSFCASEPDYISSIADFLYSPNRLNVAVSRARTKAVVISHPDVFRTLPRSFLGLQARDLCQKFLKSPESFPWYL
jgi:DNA replication ATP-dependent helicase Dna2